MSIDKKIEYWFGEQEKEKNNMRELQDIQNCCWQEVKIMRLLRTKFKGSALMKMSLLYSSLTEIDSYNENKKEGIKNYTSLIEEYSGLSKAFIPSGLKKLQALNIIKIVQDRVGGRFADKRIMFTPEKIEDIPLDAKFLEKVKLSQETGTPGFVYFLQYDEYYKIGKAKNITKRILKIIPILPKEPTLIHFIQSNDYTKCERYFHNKFKHLRANGEWFKLTEKELIKIKAINELNF